MRCPPPFPRGFGPPLTLLNNTWLNTCPTRSWVNGGFRRRLAQHIAAQGSPPPPEVWRSWQAAGRLRFRALALLAAGVCLWLVLRLVAAL
jgi:hypothetical protein